MPTIQIQGQVVELEPIDFYVYWHRYVQVLVDMMGFFSIFPNKITDANELFEASITFLRNNLEAFEDAELREQATAIIENLLPLPGAHQQMVDIVTAQLQINHPESPSGKRQLTLKWEKLIAGQTPTEAMKQAFKTLEEYLGWWTDQTQKVTRNKEQFQRRIETISPGVKGQL